MNKFFEITILFFLSLSFCLFAGGSSEEGNGKTENTFEEADTITVIDDRGVEVEIKKGTERIATFPLPHPHIIAAIDGSVDKIIGASSMSVSAARISVLGTVYPGLLDVETGYLDGQSLNVEELAKVNPDVFFTDSVLEGMENLEATGIPVIYLGLKKEILSYQGSDLEVYSPRVTMDNWVDITAQVLGKNESSASEIAQVWKDTEKEVEDKLASIPADEQVKVLIMFKTKAMAVAGKGTFGHYWIARTGGINAADEVSGKHPAMTKTGNFEDIMKWNPDVIYLSNFEDTMPDDIFSNKIDGQDWSGIEAVKNGRVHRIPLGIYRWYPPSLDGPLMLKWMAQKNYPELFDYDMAEELKAYFKKFHHYELSDAEVNAILDPASSGTL